VLDFTDCHEVSAVNVPGMWQGSGPGSPLISMACVVTARGRLEPLGGPGTEHSWTVGGDVKLIRVFSSAHDARAEAIFTQPLVN
jgi:hypothetical protein